MLYHIVLISAFLWSFDLATSSELGGTLIVLTIIMIAVNFVRVQLVN